MAEKPTALQRALIHAAHELLNISIEPICRKAFIADDEPGNLRELADLSFLVAKACDGVFEAIANEATDAGCVRTPVFDAMEENFARSLIREALKLETEYASKHPQRTDLEEHGLNAAVTL
jgi:hypothetical protein